MTPAVPAASDLEWDAGARTIRCGGAALPVPVDLSVYVRRNGGNEITVVPPGSPPGGALMALEIGPTEEHVDGSDPHFEEKILTVTERYLRLAEDLVVTWGRLHAMASGREPGEVKADFKVKYDDGMVDGIYLEDGTPGSTWRLVIVHVEPCLFTALESVRPDAAQRFYPLLERMCAATPVRCRKIHLPTPFPGSN